MASFFQPSRFTDSTATAGGSKYKVYGNAILNPHSLFDTWYQCFAFAVGIFGIVTALSKWGIQGALHAWQRRRYRPNEEREERKDYDLRKDSEALQHVKTFGFFAGQDVETFYERRFDLHIVDVQVGMRWSSHSTAHPAQYEKTHSCSSSEGTSNDQPPPAKDSTAHVFSYIDSLDWGEQNATGDRPTGIADRIDSIRKSRNHNGLVLGTELLRPREFNSLLERLAQLQVDVIVIGHPNELALNEIDLRLVSGFIFRNACIRANGTRRDFFQAERLREHIGRCNRQRKSRPHFFVGFLDLYDIPPAPAVVRRAFKFSQFHDAVLQIAPGSSQKYPEHNWPLGPQCLSGFDYLKRPEIIDLQHSWCHQLKGISVHTTSTSTTAKLDLTALSEAIPTIKSDLDVRRIQDLQDLDTSSPNMSTRDDTIKISPNLFKAPDYIGQAPLRSNFWEVNQHGERMSTRGCYDLREEPSQEAYDTIVNEQKHLHRIKMLTGLMESELYFICTTLRKMEANSPYRDFAIDLADGIHHGRVKVVKGLDSGFHIPENMGHFWAVSNEDSDEIVIYLSQKALDMPGTVLHAYLAHRGVSRLDRLDAEYNLYLSQHEGHRDMLIPRIENELESASYAELLFMMEQLRISQASHPMVDLIYRKCEQLLLSEPSRKAWVREHSERYLNGSINERELLERRLEWYKQQGATHLPEVVKLNELFLAVNNLVLDALSTINRDRLSLFTSALSNVYGKDSPTTVDINADLFGLMFFCALRKHAFDDVYVETTDRCPLFLPLPDQAAVFAELWVLGSQCEIYFNILPRTLGKIIFEKYRNYQSHNPPPVNSWNGVDVFTAYHKVETPRIIEGIGIPPANDGKLPLSLRMRAARFGSLSVFCVPAIVDVCLLTFLGRGLYLTAYMNLIERTMANYALLTALLLTAGVTGWVGSTGGYYLYSYAFDNMNHFLVQRLSGGFALASVVSICGFIAFGFEYSWYGGFIFVAYLMSLSTFLNLLGIMATMHREQSPLPSGRFRLARCMCILLISPLLTTFVNHDMLIYLLIIYTFIIVLLYNFRQLLYEWSSWTDKIVVPKQTEIVTWYMEYKQKISDSSEEETIEDKTCPEAVHEADNAHATLLAEVLAAKKNKGSRSKDPFVRELVDGYDYSIWLLEKEANNQPLPDAYTSTWLVQLGLALKNQRQLMQGLKEHSPFITYRYSKYDLGQNVGLFLIALLDRWVSISTSAHNPVYNIYFDNRARYGVSFGLLYFLISAITLDSLLQRYWGRTGRRSKERLQDFADIEYVDDLEAFAQKRRWAAAFGELTSRMIAILGVMCIFLWLFVSDSRSYINFWIYILGYSGVIIFQFNRVFTTNISWHVRIVFASAFVGYWIGIILRLVPATNSLLYTTAISLTTASCLAAFGTWMMSDFTDDARLRAETEDHALSEGSTNWKLHSMSLIGAGNGPAFEGQSIAPETLEGEDVQFNDGSLLASKITQVMRLAIENKPAMVDIPLCSAEPLVEALSGWQTRRVRMIVCPRSEFLRLGLENRVAVSNHKSEVLTIWVSPFSAVKGYHWSDSDSLEDATFFAEVLLHETAEATMGFSHQEATLAELLLNKTNDLLTSRMQSQLYQSTRAELTRISRRTNAEVMKHLCLGIDVDVAWDAVPEHIRGLVVSRIKGLDCGNMTSMFEWLQNEKVNISKKNMCLAQSLAIYQSAENLLASHKHSTSEMGELIISPQLKLIEFTQPIYVTFLGKVRHWTILSYYLLYLLVQYIAVISGGGTDAGRELWYVLRNSSFQYSVLWITLKIWKLCWWVKKTWIFLMVIHSKSEVWKILKLAEQGIPRSLNFSSISVHDPLKPRSGFSYQTPDNLLKVDIYPGLHKTAPNSQPVATAEYGEGYRLIKCTRYHLGKNGKRVQDSISEYNYGHDNTQVRWPLSKSVTEDGNKTVYRYDKYGRITQGNMIRRGKHFQFFYFYKKLPKGNCDILKAIYTCIDPEDPVTYSVYWCNTPREEPNDIQNWVPSDKLTRLVISTGTQAWDTTWIYDHKRHPVLSTMYINKGEIKPVDPSPGHATEDKFGFLKKPRTLSFDEEDLFIYHPVPDLHRYLEAVSSIRDTSKFWRRIQSWFAFRVQGRQGKTIYRKMSTSRLRTNLWQQWAKAAGHMDAVSACLADEFILRKEPFLAKYWALRDTGNLERAKEALSENLELIVSMIEVADDVSQGTPLAIKPADLFVMGTSKDATQITNRLDDCYNDTDDRLSVIFVDTGCWPDAPGGVSNCRRDLVNGHTTIRNHVLSESANDYGVPRYQTERNVQSLKVLPLWGLDGKTPYHGIFDNLLQTQVDQRIRRTDVKKDIMGTFIPILRKLVRGCRTKHYSRDDLIEFTNLFLNLNRYFEEKDFNKSWRARETVRAWREAWLEPYNDPNIWNPAEALEIEKATMSDYQEGLELWICYFFIFHVKVPESCPQVFQSTHHGIGSLYGMILKLRKGTTWGMWDHAIMWRESCLNVSPAQCILNPPVQYMLLMCMRLASHLAYSHVDVALPCTSVYNPIWETDLGTDTGRRAHVNSFRRKIDPIVNGISDMSTFNPVEQVHTKVPTVVMLSNVQFIKDVKNAIQAADVILNQFGFKDYNLIVYGAQDRQPSYAIETEELINTRGMAEKVKLGGFGKPHEVLKDAWLFMNSSLSEGLPLAIGEAALMGTPIVATEVGATAMVLTDVDDPNLRYGEVVPPNDPVALARAQISILAMLGPWARFTADEEPPPPLPEVFTPDNVKWITARMYTKAEDRRALGLKLRDVVLRKFNGDRYLREHEQMYWIHKHMAQMRTSDHYQQVARDWPGFGQPPTLLLRCKKLEQPEQKDVPWQTWQSGEGAIGRWGREYKAKRRKPAKFEEKRKSSRIPSEEDTEDLTRISSMEAGTSSPTEWTIGKLDLGPSFNEGNRVERDGERYSD